MSFNLAIMLRESAAATPEAPLLFAGDRVLSYREVDDCSGRVASALLARGLVPGDKVAVQLPNLPEFVMAYFGVLKAGLTMVPLNPLFTAREVEYHLGDSDSRALITSDSSAEAAGAGAAAAGVDDVLVVSENASIPRGATAFSDLLATAGSGEIHPTASDDTAVLLYTSGTTGRPKGAELTHFELYMNCTVAPQLFGMTAADVALGVLPLFHVFGLSSVLNAAVRYGGSVALVPRFEAAAVLDVMERRRVTVLSGVPTMYVALLGAGPGGRDLSALRAAVSGGASIPGGVLRGFEEAFGGIAVLEGYGLSETASTATFNISADQRKVLSIGKPIWGVQMRIVDPDGVELPPGDAHVGEVLVRGHNVMKGYYKRPEATAEALRDGWLHTGDLGYRDEDGYFFIVDRLKDLVIRGGYNVYPREIEEVLYTHPDVVEAAVVGRPDERLGEEVEAFVVLRPGSATDTEALTAFARERLAAYKYPRSFVILPELPKGATGKILKRELRAPR
ncbi:AMP-dependent synthetase and ligase OS=Tsukamurella paurometabola (strain ATCC 8368 / DSM /CCUG 35730 / CIP 100753 / JCM 10117 / KCTC 9821 / NBRC 16120/ NCIMB 702349 / NCTC 13040) OX=521096 GN=Tpau_1864 PE=4 SV=1 [Tsukamurella paurometabola]|uniref:AMP-dependent synthetase and ligase n=1 Tax=Tsukamurella paurometabola (strain ATCC 8368 / DSM 20162 / CCUG 35730 / CIP 100753 / JCM 10117 / KCTC 9821 / NBRC 16120 / NCIMB 702349 / NCTC 13040) TaxID=521096 RepID=D5UMY1_TSUPD|nr:long-chain fatty acid--CoA ligase [Tsukamurella paurometabola]ADG78478.1 AMP-dependent synthetase and ligase [Tsukamurella paurometabola DSM 20162]SUP31822.1 Long-chain-fatty-acid--CoA ligase [Tsukamurella paurometabola]